jgi:hypothetical protein
VSRRAMSSLVAMCLTTCVSVRLKTSGVIRIICVSKEAV